MNEYLAQLYGTHQNVQGQDIGMVKEATLLEIVKLAEANNVDPESLSAEQIKELAEKIEGDEEEKEKETTAALHFGDLAGRTAAHAFHHEMNKLAGPRTEAVKSFFRGQGGAYKDVGRSLKGIVTGKPTREMMEKAALENLSEVARPRREALKALGSSLKATAPTLVPGALAVGGGAYGAKKAFGRGQEKKSYHQEFENAATARAWEMLAEAGYLEKNAEEAQVQGMIEQRALELLAEAGYPIQ
jgi:hypothetical protein